MGRRIPKSLIFRNGLKELYLEAQAILHPSQYDTFLSWLEEQLNSNVKDFLRSEIGYEELNGVADVVPLAPIENQLLWLAARFNRQRLALNEFLYLKEDVEQSALRGDYTGSLETLEKIDSKFGNSIWSVQLKIALLQLRDGLEEQKRFTAEVRKVYRNGLLGFVAFFTSVRNEEKTTFQKFISEVHARISNHKHYSVPVKDFLIVLLAQEWPKDVERMLGILQVSESHSLVDVYETFIGFSQEITEQRLYSGRHTSAERAFKRSLNKIKGISDPRIAKLQLSNGEPIDWREHRTRDESLLNNLLSGKTRSAYTELSTGSGERAPIDAWTLVYLAYLNCSEDLSDLYSSETLAGLTITSIASILAGQDRVEWSGTGLKLCANFSPFLSLNGVRKYLDALLGRTPEITAALASTTLNSHLLGSEDLLIGADVAGRSPPSEESPSQSFWYTLRYGKEATFTPKTLHGCIALGLWNVREGNYSAAISLLKKAERLDTSGIFDLVIFDSLLTSQIELGKYSQVIELIAGFVAKYPNSFTVLPKCEIIGELTWDDFGKISRSSLKKAIGLHISWTIFEREIDATRLRFVTGNLVRTLGVSLPSDLVEHKELFNIHDLVYFLKYVCISSILDGTRLFRSSREVMEERQRVCAVLRELDPNKADQYEEEIAFISNQLTHHDVQHIVDSTRIYVDTDSLKRWAIRELSEDIERYKDLANVDFDDQVNFDDLFADLSQTAQKQDVTFKPETESELLLLKIFDRIREEFLNNPSFGLDFYLSKRIRHQSFIGFIRGPLEFSKLITNKETEHANYSPNNEWVERFLLSNAESKEDLLSSFARFSEKFDRILEIAKNNKFQIRSQDKPDGLIFLNLSAHSIRLAQIVVRLDLSVEDFITTAVAVCWAQLELSLSAARSYITTTLKSDVVRTFDELRASIKKKIGNTERALEADIEIGQISTEVQRKLDETKKWFSHSDIEKHKRSFKLDHIANIAIDSSLKCHRAFEPKISSNVQNGDMELTAGALIFINDAISAGISNSEKHSGLRRPKLDIEIIPIPEEQRLLVQVVTDSKPSNREFNQKRVEEIKKLIQDGDFHRRSRKEGGSGFIKLAAVVQQSNRGAIEFGFRADGRFHLTVYYSLIVETSGQAHESEPAF